MDQRKRERAANFSNDEVKLLINLVEKYAVTLENKKTDAVTNKHKAMAWSKVQESFNSCGVGVTPRSWKTLKAKYEGLKGLTKKKAFLHRQELMKTGGDQANAPEFDEIDQKILRICENVDGQEYDSDCTLAHAVEVVDEEPNVKHKKPCLRTEEDPILTEPENSWDKWQPQAPKIRVASNIMEPSDVISKGNVTAKLNKLSEARLELVQLQMESAKQHQEFMEEEHQLKMLHLANEEKRKQLQMESDQQQNAFMEEERQLKMLHLTNEEKRKQEMHELMMEKFRCARPVLKFCNK